MADPDDLEGSDYLIGNVKTRGHWVGKHHVEEVLHVTVLLLGINDGQSHGGSIGVSGEGWHLGYELDCQFLSVIRIEEIIIRVHEGRERSDNADHDGHRMSRTLEPFVEVDNELVDHHFADNDILEFGELGSRGQAAIEQEIAGFHIGGVISEILNPVSPVHELSFLPVDVRDIGDAAGSAHETRVISENICLREQSSHVDHLRPKGALQDRQLDLLVSDFQDCFLGQGLGLFGFHLV